MHGKMFAEAKAQAYASFASARYVQLSLSIRLELPDPRRYIEPKKGLRNEKLHSTNRNDSVVGHLLSAPSAYPVRSTPNTSVVVLWLP
jgi:hypothetical protein